MKREVVQNVKKIQTCSHSLHRAPPSSKCAMLLLYINPSSSIYFSTTLLCASFPLLLTTPVCLLPLCLLLGLCYFPATLAPSPCLLYRKQWIRSSPLCRRSPLPWLPRKPGLPRLQQNSAVGFVLLLWLFCRFLVLLLVVFFSCGVVSNLLLCLFFFLWCGV